MFQKDISDLTNMSNRAKLHCTTYEETGQSARIDVKKSQTRNRQSAASSCRTARGIEIFGLTAEQVESTRATYDSQTIIKVDPDLARVMDLLESGHFNRFEKGLFDSVIGAIRSRHDPWLVAADFGSFVEAQEKAAAA